MFKICICYVSVCVYMMCCVLFFQDASMFLLNVYMNRMMFYCVFIWFCYFCNDFNADTIIWMDTIKKGRFDDTNKLFEKPNYYDVRVTEKNSELWAAKIFEKLKDEKK